MIHDGAKMLLSKIKKTIYFDNENIFMVEKKKKAKM